jgi:hypothetical protein
MHASMGSGKLKAGGIVSISPKCRKVNLRQKNGLKGRAGEQ